MYFSAYTSMPCPNRTVPEHAQYSPSGAQSWKSKSSCAASLIGCSPAPSSPCAHEESRRNKISRWKHCIPCMSLFFFLEIAGRPSCLYFFFLVMKSSGRKCKIIGRASAFLLLLIAGGGDSKVANAALVLMCKPDINISITSPAQGTTIQRPLKGHKPLEIRFHVSNLMHDAEYSWYIHMYIYIYTYMLYTCNM